MRASARLVACAREALADRGLSTRAAEARAGLPTRSIQGALEGHVPSVDRAAEICDALGLELYIGPPRGPRAAAGSETGGAESQIRRVPTVAPTPDQVAGAPVRDRVLAELLAAVVAHWEQLGTRYARATWIADVYRWCPALSAQRSALSEIVAWLGWRVIERRGRGKGAGPGEG